MKASWRTMPNDTQMQDFIDEHLATIRPLSRDSALAWWENAQTGSDEAAERAADLTAHMLKVYAEREPFAFLQGLHPDVFADPLLARQHDVLRRAFLAEQMAPETIDQLV